MFFAILCLGKKSIDSASQGLENEHKYLLDYIEIILILFGTTDAFHVQ